MIEYLGKGLFGLLILLSIIGIVIGAESPGYTVYVQESRAPLKAQQMVCMKLPFRNHSILLD